MRLPVFWASREALITATERGFSRRVTASTVADAVAVPIPRFPRIHHWHQLHFGDTIRSGGALAISALPNTSSTLLSARVVAESPEPMKRRVRSQPLEQQCAETVAWNQVRPQCDLGAPPGRQLDAIATIRSPASGRGAAR
jgi:hypothetical protein